MSFELPMRAGPRPKTTDCAPHEQVSQNSPPEIHTLFKRRAFELPFVERRASAISVPGAEALVLPHAHACGPREAFMIGREFAHVHPRYDGSSHLMLPLPVVEELIAKGWGEPHPMARLGYIPVTPVMAFAPRDEVEVDVMLRLLTTSWDFACGKLANPAPVHVHG
jgi:hypothetical protein